MTCVGPSDYDALMSIETNPENTVCGAYGEFETFGTADWSDEDWRAYDAHVAAEMDEWDAAHRWDEDMFVPDESDIQAPF